MYVLNVYEVPKISFFGFTCPLKGCPTVAINERMKDANAANNTTGKMT